MNVDHVEAYLAALSIALRKRGVSNLRLIEEVRGHLADAVEQGMARGLDENSAQREAIAQFGSAESVAGTFVSETYGIFGRLVLLAGALLRPSAFSDERRPEFHDRTAPFHFLVMSKRGWVNPELAAIAADPDTQLIPFLERMAPAALGPLGKAQSVTPLDDAGMSTRVKKFQVVFGDERKVICRIEIGRGGKSVSVHWSKGGGGD
jgi:hypothetical protein